MNLTKRQKKSVTIFTVVLLAVAAAGYYFANRYFDRDSATAGTTSSETGQITRVLDVQQLPAIELKQVDSYTRTVVHTGSVETRSHTMVAFQRGGMVTDLLVDEGQLVAALQDMAVLDSRHLEAQQDSLAAKLAQANSVLAELEKGPRQESIDTARNVVTDLEQQLKAQDLRAKRSASLLRSNSIAKQDYERELYAMRGLEARLNAAKSQLDELRAGTRTEQIDAQESSIKSIQAEQQALQYNLDDCQLRAPFSGMVVTRYIDPGTVVTAGTPVYELIDDKNLEVHIGVPRSFASQLQPGANYTVIAGKVRLAGTLRAVLPRVDAATRTCKAIIDVTMPDDNPTTLVTGQLARVELAQEIKQSGFWIPRLALTADHSGLWSCFVVSGNSTGSADGSVTNQPVKRGTAKKQSVEILHHRDEWVFVRGTLGDGQLLISDGMHRIVPGQQIAVQVTDPTPHFTSDLSVVPAMLESPGANQQP